MIEKGMKGTAIIKADSTNSAKAMGSGSLDVFATPAMVALMEKSAVNCLEGHLDEGMTSVGTFINTEHISATPLNMEVTAEAEITDINGREIIFTVTALDSAGIIGKGTHKRFIVNSEKFMSKTNSKI
jgi:predicted thioesterase